MKSLRPTLLKLHRWLGLAFAALLLMQAVTGSFLTFRGEIERIIHPSIVVTPTGTRAPLQVLLDTVRAAHPEYGISRANLSADYEGVVLFRLAPMGEGALRLVAVDPYRNRIVRDGTIGHWPGEILLHLHEELVAGHTGKTIVGLGGLALLFLGLTGLVVWWSGLRRLRSGFRMILYAGADPAWRSLHRVIGATAALCLIFLATTGALMVWKEVFRDGLRLFGPVIEKPTPKVLEETDRLLLPVDRLVTQAQASYGNMPLQQLRFPGGHGRVVVVLLESKSSARPGAMAQIYYNAYTGEELDRYVAGELPAGNEAVDWLYPLHTGEFGGIPGRLFVLLSGFALIFLCGSGAWLWLSRRSKRRLRKPSLPA